MGSRLDYVLSEWDRFYWSCKKSISPVLKNYLDENGKVLVSFVAYILTYGILVNLMLALVLGYQIWVGSVLGYGIAWYLFKQELPDFIRSIRSGRR